jgi:lipopolysaccharide export system protein LptA
VKILQNIIFTTFRANCSREMFLIVTAFLLSSLVFAQDQPEDTDAKKAGEQIQIEADKLITNNEKEYAEFIGNVTARQGNFVITSDTLRIYYEGDLINQKKDTEGQEAIKRIVARGDVKISSDNYSAETEKVEYDMDTKVLVLSGQNSKVTRGKHSVIGSKITLDRKDGQIKVEGSPDERVKAVFYSTENISDTFETEDSGSKTNESALKDPEKEPVKNRPGSSED